MPRNNELPSYESLLEFQEVWLRAIALAWADSPQKPAHPEKMPYTTFSELLQKNPESALKDYLGYVCPWNLKLQTKVPPPGSCHWVPGKDGQTGHWENLPRNGISFGLPVAPVIEQQAVAFAAYNDAGPTYLFTCC
jgi:ribosomally synthesized peptide (two-chain TOMM family)